MEYRRHIVLLKILTAGLFALITLLSTTQRVSAQQDPMFTQYMENIMFLNPAYAGSREGVSMMAVSRNQWVSMNGAPVSRGFAVNSPISGAKMGLGFSFLNDEISVVKQSGFYVDYAYKLFLNNGRNLALGLKAGVNFYEAGISGLLINDPNDPVFAEDIDRNFLPNLGVGAFFNTNRYYFGLSIPKLIENTINKNGLTVQSVSKERIHLFFMAGYVFDVNRIVKFKPSILTKYVKNAPFSIDLNGSFVFYDRLWLGAMYRFGDSFGGMFQLQATDHIRIGYSYDLPVNALGAFNGGTHEIMLSYDFSLGGGRVRSPRYF